MEEHFVTTPDGYILGLHRIPADPHSPRSHFNPSSSSSGGDGDGTHDSEDAESVDGADQPSTVHALRPVLIVHGFMHSSEAFIRLNASDSLPLVLNEAGYDVWLGSILYRHSSFFLFIFRISFDINYITAVTSIPTSM